MLLNREDTQSVILEASAIRELEGLTVHQGKSLRDLMESAGRAVFHFILETFSCRPTFVLCGPGNNGGDGYVVARLLKEAGWPVKVMCSLSHPPQLSEHALYHKNLWQGSTLDLTAQILPEEGLVVDALFGIGLKRPLKGIYAEVVVTLNQLNLPCVAMDMPTGIQSDTGEIMGVALKAHTTLTFGTLKPGHLLLPGRLFSGHVKVADIGLSKPDGQKCALFANSPGLWQQHFPYPSLTTHKYERGHLLVLGGRRRTGASRLAAYAARRIGAGMVTLACSPDVEFLYAQSSPGLVIDLMEAQDSFDVLLTKNPKISAALLGSGSGVSSDTKKAVLATLAKKLPCVLDADALTLFKDCPHQLFSAIQGSCVLTPHEGEFAKLFNREGDKLMRARKAAQQSNAVVVLKGADTIVAHPNGLAVIQNNAPPTLATAGSGDVLAGMIAGLLAQGVEAFEASCMATWVHGQAAALFGIGLIAEDLIDLIPQALRELRIEKNHKF